MSRKKRFSSRPLWCFALCVLLFAIPKASGLPYYHCSEGPGCVFDSWNRDGVSNNPPIFPVFTLSASSKIVEIFNYHYNFGEGQDPIAVKGTISLYDDTTNNLVGTWTALDGNFGAPGWSWVVYPNVLLGPGSYRIVDSDASTWSYSTTDFFHLPGDGPDWKPYQGFSKVWADVPEPANVILAGGALAAGLLLFRYRRERVTRTPQLS